MTYLNHLTINTGKLRRSPRDEVSTDTIADTSSRIAAMLQDGRADLPIPGYHIEGQAYGPSLAVTVMGGADPLATIAIARRDRDGRAMWRDLMDAVGGIDASLVRDPPGAPYAAVMLWPALALEADAASWIGDLGRVLAWSWIDA
ncbi:hypothetical protein SAMIE_1015650 [Sphingobium amiense]|uniref:Uncharacterized protein n=1 Tax=Sphingobium amiense TaxID=135719 RepID=A0A494W076_9SPHN|nr:hypothetical protein [Sphingobium amiense]BBD98064.1 hypothetical protein SAMIE_1015650 [Sphingobium amiense]